MHRVWAYYQPDLVLDFTQGAGDSMYSGFRRAGNAHALTSDLFRRAGDAAVGLAKGHVTALPYKSHATALPYNNGHVTALPYSASILLISIPSTLKPNSGPPPGLVHTPVIKVVSDFEGLGIHKWIEDTHQYIICGTSRCREQALNFGIPPRQVFQTSGMILRPDFYESAGGVTEGRESALENLGLDPTVRLGPGMARLLSSALLVPCCCLPHTWPLLVPFAEQQGTSQVRTALVCWGGVGGNIVLDLGKAILASQTRYPPKPQYHLLVAKYYHIGFCST